MHDEKAIFEVACHIDDVNLRERYLSQVCAGDTPLRQRVGKLLQMHDEEPEYLEASSPIAALKDIFPIGVRPPGTVIGDYRLREQIGEGGMGVVYVAEQTAPLQRKVALKIIKPGMASKDVVARFDAERQALAMMDHPNIARVFDGGETESGEPYFVMELVQGPPITEYCDEQRLSTRQRLDLFRQVCQAVQHAHQKGIIHRDLKPSNVLVPRIDGEPVPKVIDFGVAKAVHLGMKLTEQTVYTQFAQMVGTPLYMSPEQTEPGVVDIDTRSDVYSLGVLLYELLTGGTPFDSDVLKQAGFDEMRRIIREEDPPRPSAKVSTLKADALSTVSERRRSDPRTLRDSLHGELDWLVMKALEKDRNRRYGSASEISDDVGRFLAGEAIHAHPPSRLYQIRKFARRHRAAVATVVVFLLLLLGGVVGTSWQMLRAMEAEQHAETATVHSRAQAQRAMDSLELARGVVDQFYLELGTRWIADETAPSNFQSSMLAEAADFYRELAELPVSASKSNQLLLVASGYQRLAQIDHYLHNFDQAVDAYQECIEALQKAHAKSARDSKLRSKLSEIHYNLGQSLAELARFDEALSAYDRAGAIARELVSDGAQPTRYQQLLAQIDLARAEVLLNTDRLSEAGRLAQSARDELNTKLNEVDRNNPRWETPQLDAFRADLCRTKVMAYDGKLSDAATLCQRSLDRIALRRTAYNEDARVRQLEIDFLELSAQIDALRGELPSAVETCRRALEVRREGLLTGLAPEHFFMESTFKKSTNMDGQIEFGPFCEYVEADQRLAKILRRYGRPYAAENILGECRTVTAVLIADRPNSLRYHVADANTWTLAAELLSESRADEASILFRRARELWSQIIPRFPQAKQFVSGVHGIEPDWQYFQRVNDLFDELPVSQYAAEEHDTIFVHHSNGHSWARIQDWDAAIGAFKRSLAKRTHDRAYDWLQLAIVHSKLGQLEKAKELIAMAEDSIVARENADVELDQLLSIAAGNLKKEAE